MSEHACGCAGNLLVVHVAAIFRWGTLWPRWSSGRGNDTWGNGAEEAGDEGTTPQVFIIGIAVAAQQQGGHSKPIKPKTS
jgi:hypothetical protein